MSYLVAQDSILITGQEINTLIEFILATKQMYLHSTVFFPAGRGINAQASFLLRSLISLIVASFHFRSATVSFQSCGYFQEL